MPAPHALPQAQSLTISSSGSAINPRRVPLQRWIERGVDLEGTISVATFPTVFPRLSEACAEAPREAMVWRACGLLEHQAGGADPTRRHWLRLQALVHPPLRCNRCLETFLAEVHIERRFLVVADEATAESLDAPHQDDFDVIADAPDADLLALLEDEILLALPIVPMHPACEVPHNPGRRPQFPVHEAQQAPLRQTEQAPVQDEAQSTEPMQEDLPAFGALLRRQLGGSSTS